MEPYPIAGKSPRRKRSLRSVSSPTSPASKKPSLSSSTCPVDSAPFSVLGCRVSKTGDGAEVRFSDQTFIFYTRWLYNSRGSEGLPSSDGCKNPSQIRIKRIEVAGVGVTATVDITWNTGTTSRFPALFLRVYGPTEALGQERCKQRVPEPIARNPRSGVEKPTVLEKSVAGRYRAELVDILKVYIEEEWLSLLSNQLLREVMRYLEVEQSRVVSAQAPAAEASQNDATGDSSGVDSLTGAEVSK